MRAVIASINFSRTAPFLLELSIQRHDSKPWCSYEDIIRSAQTCHLAGWSLLEKWWSIAAAHTPKVEIESTNLAVDSTMTLMNNEFRQTNFSIKMVVAPLSREEGSATFPTMQALALSTYSSDKPFSRFRPLLGKIVCVMASITP